MPLIRCTRKLVAEIGTQVASPAGQGEAAILGDWYANLLQIGRRKCVIFTSERTLLKFVVIALNRDAIRDYATLFRRGLRQVLESEGFAPGDVDRALDGYEDLTIAPTTDRTVLGSLNDLARLAAAHVQSVGGLLGCDLAVTNHELNLTPMKRLGMASPLATTRRVFEGGDHAAHSTGRPSTGRKKRPVRMELDAVGIERQGETAILTPRDPGIAVTHLRLGTDVDRMRDEEILACFNATIAAMDRLAAEHPYVATGVPPGRPQIRYHPRANQWTPRGGVVRCVIESDRHGQVIINIDGRELPLEEFGKLLSTYEGWGMRIEFTPDDATERRPRLEVREPDEP